MRRPVIPLEVYELFDALALQVVARGYSRYSSDAILHRIRWHYHIDKGDREFKCNDHWTATLARWWLKKHPEYPEFFELRILRSDMYYELPNNRPILLLEKPVPFASFRP
jgi:hypothetical protein